MAELATIARPYAEALYKATGTQATATVQWLDALASVAGNAQLLQFARIDAAGSHTRHDAFHVADFRQFHFAEFAEIGLFEEVFHTVLTEGDVGR